MELHHISHVKCLVCPECGNAEVLHEGRSQHASGNWFEYREFKCEYKLEYSPQTQLVTKTHECTKSKEYQVETARRIKLLSTVKGCLTRSEIDTDTAGSVISSMEYTLQIYTRTSK